MPRCILGWDVGGANIKAARLSVESARGVELSEVVATHERPFPLWREPVCLPGVLAEIAETVGPAEAMAVTMTAELADCFATKRDGVAFVLGAFQAAFPGIDVRVYGVDGRFRSMDDARRAPEYVGAANWMASATIVAASCADAILIDVGSTTADVIPIVAGRVAARGLTDAARLQSGELVYTGALRTPVCAIAPWVPLRGRRCRVAAELFAVTADVHLWMGHIDESAYTCETPDGRGRSRGEVAARLARIVCADLEMLLDADITAIAAHVAARQRRQITAGIRQVLRGLGATCPDVALVAGSGAWLAGMAAAEAGLVSRDLADILGAGAARVTPAAAVAYWLARGTDASREWIGCGGA